MNYNEKKKSNFSFLERCPYFANFRQFSTTVGKTVEKLKNYINNAPTRQYSELETHSIIVDTMTLSRKNFDDKKKNNYTSFHSESKIYKNILNTIIIILLFTSYNI